MIVLLHGVPETDALWARLAAYLPDPVEVLRLPGFAEAPPTGFGCTKDEYASWLAEQLSQHAEPVHLVGHDWGAPLALQVAATRPELVRSWVVDATYAMHEDYRWHALARVWQTRGLGEAFWLAYVRGSRAFAARPYRRFGLSAEDADIVAGMANPHMARSVVRLYRSALPNLHAHWGDLASAAAVPGLVIDAGEDTFGSSAQAHEVAERLGARVETYPDLGHWWAMQDPRRAAQTLRTFWASLP